MHWVNRLGGPWIGYYDDHTYDKVYMSDTKTFKTLF